LVSLFWHKIIKLRPCGHTNLRAAVIGEAFEWFSTTNTTDVAFHITQDELIRNKYLQISLPVTFIYLLRRRVVVYAARDANLSARHPTRPAMLAIGRQEWANTFDRHRTRLFLMPERSYSACDPSLRLDKSIISDQSDAVKTRPSVPAGIGSGLVMSVFSTRLTGPSNRHQDTTKDNLYRSTHEIYHNY